MNFIFYLKENKIISDDKVEIVNFGLKQLKLIIINWISIYLIGLIFKIDLSSILFIFFFSILRSFAGGFHAKTTTRCYFLSMFLIITGFASWNMNIWSKDSCIAVTIICVVILLKIVPVDNQKRRLDILEKKIFKKIAIIILIVEATIVFLAVLLNLKMIYETITLSILLVTGLALAEVLKK